MCKKFNHFPYNFPGELKSRHFKWSPYSFNKPFLSKAIRFPKTEKQTSIVCGISSKLCSRISSHPYNRRISIVLHSHSSSFYLINSGIPQSSVIVLTLYLLNINDLFNFKSNLQLCWWRYSLLTSICLRQILVMLRKTVARYCALVYWMILK